MTGRPTLRVLIAGGGAVGSVTALALARAGAQVTLADPAALGDNASGLAAGMLAPAFEAIFDDLSAPRLALMRRARDLWPKLAGSIGLVLDRAGAMAVGAPDNLAAWADAGRSLGISLTALSPAEARRRLPWLAAGQGGLWTDEDWRLEADLALVALRAAGHALGVRTIARAVNGFEPGRARLADGRELAVDALVVATGASRSLVDVAPELAGLMPVKGHILRAPGHPLSGPVVRLNDGYICPSPGGALIGSSMEIGRADREIDAAVVQRLIGQAIAFAPCLAGATVTARAGVRAATAGGLPLVGRSEAAGVWLAVGARRNGWLLAPLIAQGLAARLTGRGRDDDPFAGAAVALPGEADVK
ncbi:MAG TPA: FAD-dependent oxidoreductase [Caulobacteraceae bacterium]